MTRYIFTQQHRDNLPWWNGTWLPQTVPDDAELQIQLPSDPIRWNPHHNCPPSRPSRVLPEWLLALRSRVEVLRTGTMPNGPIPGAAAISTFDYRVHGIGIASICLQPEPVPDDPQALGFPPGTPPYFVLTVLVGVPQLSAG